MLRLLLPLLAVAAPPPPDPLDSYINTFYLAEARLREFDRALDKERSPGFLARSAAYRDLLALRAILERAAHELSERYRTDSARTELRGRIGELGPVERIALQELLPSLGGKGLPVFYASLDQELEARRLAAGGIADRMKRAEADPLLAKALEAERKGIILSEAAPARGEVKPSPGPEGTINGALLREGSWALSFDDGPHPVHTPNILSTLHEAGIRASFLWLVERLEGAPSLVARAKTLGMVLGNHSWTHPNLASAPPALLEKEIGAATERQRAIYGAAPAFFRLPYGAGLRSPPARERIAAAGMIHVFWNIDSLDWKDKDPKSIVARVRKLMASEKRGILLFHDIHPQSAAAISLLTGKTRKERWLTLEEAVHEMNAVYRKAGP